VIKTTLYYAFWKFCDRAWFSTLFSNDKHFRKSKMYCTVTSNMKKYLEQPVIAINNKTYLSLIVLLSPLLNFLSGINIDIYSPSMPSIATYFDVSVIATKNMITIQQFSVNHAQIMPWLKIKQQKLFIRGSFSNFRVNIMNLFKKNHEASSSLYL